MLFLAASKIIRIWLHVFAKSDPDPTYTLRVKADTVPGRINQENATLHATKYICVMFTQARMTSCCPGLDYCAVISQPSSSLSVASRPSKTPCSIQHFVWSIDSGGEYELTRVEKKIYKGTGTSGQWIYSYRKIIFMVTYYCTFFLSGCRLLMTFFPQEVWF